MATTLEAVLEDLIFPDSIVIIRFEEVFKYGHLSEEPYHVQQSAACTAHAEPPPSTGSVPS